MKVSVAISDIVAGLFASSAVLAALHERERSGRGQHVRASLLQGLAGQSTYNWMLHLLAQRLRRTADAAP